MLKQKSIIRNRIASVGYMEKEMKWLITNEWKQKDYKTRHDWVGKVIHWELCKKFKFAHPTKW